LENKINIGRHLAIASDRGVVTVWTIGDKLRQNIFKVLDSMNSTEDFWAGFPIFLYIEPE
jgi:hypothetical protein